MPGIGEDIDGAIQQAAHPTRHSIMLAPVVFSFVYASQIYHLIHV